MLSDEMFAIYSAEFPGITRDRLQFINNIANDTWVDGLTSGDDEFEAQLLIWRERAIEFVTTCTEPRELFIFVEMYNWDKGNDLLKAVAVNPVCDVSTALAMFWMSSPIFYQEYASDQVSGSKHEDLNFLLGLLSRLNAGLYQPLACSFDPMEWDAEDANRPGSKWHIPPYMCQPIVV